MEKTALHSMVRATDRRIWARRKLHARGLLWYRKFFQQPELGFDRTSYQVYRGETFLIG